MLYIKFLRHARGLTQGQLGVLTGIHQPAVSLIEAGRLLPTTAELDRLARVLGVAASLLLTEARVEPDTAPAAREAAAR